MMHMIAEMCINPKKGTSTGTNSLSLSLCLSVSLSLTHTHKPAHKHTITKANLWERAVVNECNRGHVMKLAAL